MRKLKSVLMVAGFVAAFLVIGAAKASASTFDLKYDHCTGGCGPVGTIFGTVTLTQNGANVDILVQLSAGYSWAKTGAVDFQAFKFNGTGVALGDITVDQTWAGNTLAPQTGSFTGDGTGSFVFGIACTSCGNGSSAITSNISAHVANAVVADLAHANVDGYVFVVDLYGAASGRTGPVANRGCTANCGEREDRDIPEVPEPTTLVLLGTGLLFATKGLRKFAKR